MSSLQQVLEEESIVATIFLWCDAPIAFSRLSSKIRAVATLQENQIAWIQNHPTKLDFWATSFHSTLENLTRAIDWLLVVHSHHQSRNSVCWLLRRKGVLVSTVRHAFQKEYQNDTEKTLQIALLAYAARQFNMDAIRVAFQFPHTLDLLRSAFIWKEIACAIIHCGEESDLPYLEKLIELHPDIAQELEDAPAFASRLGKLSMLKTLVFLGKYHIHTRLVDMLNHAHDKHFTEIVQYLCDEGNATDEGQSVVRTWKAIGAAAEAFETSDEEKITQIIDSLLSEPADDQFRARWKAITLMASSKGSYNILKRLLSFMTNPSFSAAKLGLTHRMIVMALSTQNFVNAMEIINYVDRGTLHAAEHVIFGNLPDVGLPRLNQLLYRFCASTNLSLFRSMFPTFPEPEKALSAWLDTVKGHRLDMIEFLLQNCFGLDPQFNISNECIWAAFRSGHVEIAEALKTAGGDIGWMEEFSGDYSLSADLVVIPEEKEHQNVDNAPASALTVIRGYGTTASSVLSQHSTPAEMNRLQELDAYLRENDVAKENKGPLSSKMARSSSPIFGHMISRIRSKQFFATAPLTVMTTDAPDSLWDALLKASPNDIGNLIKGGSKEGSVLAWMEPSQSADVDIPSYLQMSYQTLSECTSAPGKTDFDRAAVMYGLGGSYNL